MQLANFKLDDNNLRKFGKKGCKFVKKRCKTDFDVDPRVPINSPPIKWMITPEKTNKKANYSEINIVQHETKIIEEKLECFGNNFDGIIDYLFNNCLSIKCYRSYQYS
jgi:hypothetical protein